MGGLWLKRLKEVEGVERLKGLKRLKV